MDTAMVTAWLTPFVALIPVYIGFRSKMKEMQVLLDQSKMTDKAGIRDDNREDFNMVIGSMRIDYVDLKEQVKSNSLALREAELTILSLRKELLECDRKMFGQEQEIARLKSAEKTKNAQHEAEIKRLTAENADLKSQLAALRSEHETLVRLVSLGSNTTIHVETGNNPVL